MEKRSLLPFVDKETPLFTREVWPKVIVRYVKQTLQMLVKVHNSAA